MALANFLDDTVVVDLSSVTHRALLPMLSERSVTPHPEASPDTDAHGATTNFWPWGVESSNAMRGRSGRVDSFVATYVLPYEDDTYFVGHSLDVWPEPVTRLVSDPDTGEAASRLVAQHLAALWAALRQGAEGLPQGWGLIKVRTDHDYWFFAGLLESRTPGSVDIDPAEANAVFEGAMAVLGQTLGFPGNLPGILTVLPPDKVAARNQKLAEGFTTAADILSNLRDVIR